MKSPIKVMIVDDSAVARDYLTYVIGTEPDMHVVGTAKNGMDAIKISGIKKPDIILMDIEMPVMNGFEATRKIMETNPVPIVIVSSYYEKSEVEKTFEAMDAGALAILAKPEGFKHPNHEKSKKKLADIVRTMSEVRVVTRKSRNNLKNTIVSTEQIPFNEKGTKYQLTAIGVSTGGPQVLNKLLPLIPENFDMPVVVVQHISPGFLEGMIDWLSKSTKLKVKIACDGEVLEKGNIYFCPDNYNMGITKKLRVVLKKEVPGFTITPSVSYMFKTVAENIEQKAIGILLTGMGRDGAEELALMKDKGALTIAQDEKSSIVYGMPGEAVKLNAHRYILSPEGVGRKLVEINNHQIR